MSKVIDILLHIERVEDRAESGLVDCACADADYLEVLKHDPEFSSVS